MVLLFCIISIAYTDVINFSDCAFAEAGEKLQKVIVDCMLSYKENFDQDILKKVVLKEIS